MAGSAGPLGGAGAPVEDAPAGIPAVAGGSSAVPAVDRSLERPLFRPLQRTLGRGLEALSGRATVRVRRSPPPER